MTYTEFKEAYAEIPITYPFGFNDRQKVLPPENYFTVNYSVPVVNGGHRVSRHELNGLGFLSTIGTFLDSYGYQYEWRDLSSLGGYPKNAVVSKIDTNGFQKYVNIEDDNTKEPDNSDLTGEETGWKPLLRMQEYNFFPDYSSRTKIWEYRISKPTPLDLTKIPIENSGWVLIERRIDNWTDVISSLNSYGLNGIFDSYVTFIPSIDIELNENNKGRVLPQFRIPLTEGESASRFYPCSNGFTIGGNCSSPVSGITISVYLYNMET